MSKTPYTPQFQHDVIEFRKNNSLKATKAKFNISHTTIRAWTNPVNRIKQIQQQRDQYAKLKPYVLQKRKKWNRKDLSPENVSIRYKNHLSYAYTPEQCQRELEILNSKNGNYDRVSNSNKIVLTYQSHYYEYENKLWLENKNGLRDKLLANRLKYINKDEYTINEKEVLRGFKISAIHIGYSHFNPLWIKKFIQDHNIQSIYDPTGGWGHRLIGSENILYIYNDLDPRTYQGCVNIVKDLKLTNKVLYNQDCSKFTPNEDYEAVFTCPPYYNTEIYNNKMFKDLDDYTKWWGNTIKSSLKAKVKYFAYVINNQYKDILEQVCIENNLKLKEVIPMGISFNHFQNKAQKFKGELLYIFSTGLNN